MPDKTTLDYLVAARAAIAAPENWCRNCVLIKDMHTGVESYCAWGAVNMAVYGSASAGSLLDMPSMEQLFWALPDDSEGKREGFDARAGVIRYNNTHTHAEVLALFDRAIARQRVLEDRTLPAPLPDPEAKDCAPRSDFHDAWFPTI